MLTKDNDAWPMYLSWSCPRACHGRARAGPHSCRTGPAAAAPGLASPGPTTSVDTTTYTDGRVTRAASAAPVTLPTVRAVRAVRVASTPPTTLNQVYTFFTI